MTLYSGIHSLGGQLHRLVDLEISGTATEVARERLFDLDARRVRIGREQRFRSEEKRGRTISALRRTQVSERLLQRMQLASLGHCFDGAHATSSTRQAKNQAGQHRRAVEQHGTG